MTQSTQTMVFWYVAPRSLVQGNLTFQRNLMPPSPGQK